MTRIGSFGALTAEQPNVTTLRVAAMSPLLERSASMVTKAVTRVVLAFTAEKAGSMIGVFAGGSAGGAAGTMLGKGIDNVVSSSPSFTAPEPVTNAGQVSSVYQLVAKGIIPWEQAQEEVKRLNAYDLATACVRQGKTIEDIENIL